MVKIEAYFRIVADEAELAELKGKLDIENVVVKKIKATAGNPPRPLWNWQTEIIELNEATLDEELQVYVARYADRFERAKLNIEGFYLELVFYYGDDELPRGLALSNKTLSLLARTGADLDLDAVRLLD